MHSKELSPYFLHWFLGKLSYTTREENLPTGHNDDHILASGAGPDLTSAPSPTKTVSTHRSAHSGLSRNCPFS